MKKTFLLSFMTLLSFAGIVNAQDCNIVSKINECFQTGTYVDISKYMTDDIEAFVVNRQCDTKTKAAKALTDLFHNKQINSYKVLHSGENGNSTFIVASFTLDETNYRINLLLKDNKIAELRIDTN